MLQNRYSNRPNFEQPDTWGERVVQHSVSWTGNLSKIKVQVSLLSHEFPSGSLRCMKETNIIVVIIITNCLCGYMYRINVCIYSIYIIKHYKCFSALQNDVFLMVLLFSLSFLLINFYLFLHLESVYISDCVLIMWLCLYYLLLSCVITACWWGLLKISFVVLRGHIKAKSWWIYLTFCL